MNVSVSVLIVISICILNLFRPHLLRLDSHPIITLRIIICPKLNSLIIGKWWNGVSQWTPCNVKNSLILNILICKFFHYLADRPAQLGLILWWCIPERNLTITIRRGEEGWDEGVPLHWMHFTGILKIHQFFFLLSDIVDFYKRVLRAAKKAVPILMPSHFVHIILMWLSSFNLKHLSRHIISDIFIILNTMIA